MPTTRHPAVIAGLATAAVLATVLAGSTGASAATPAGPKLPTGDPCCGIKNLTPGHSLRSDYPLATLNSLGLGRGPYNEASTYGGYYLRVQNDGNLVEYDVATNAPVWSTGTAGAATPTTLTFQTDGNVVLYDAANKPLWATGTAGRPAAYFDVYGNGQVVTQDANGRVLSTAGPAATPLPGMVVDGARDQESDAPTGRNVTSTLDVQADGNVVEYQYSNNADGGGSQRAVWSTGTAGAGRVHLVAQADGNLVVYQVATGRAVWASGTRGPNAFYELDVQGDGNVVLYRTDGATRLNAVWASGTRG